MEERKPYRFYYDRNEERGMWLFGFYLIIAVVVLLVLFALFLPQAQEDTWNVTVYFHNGKVMSFKADRKAWANEDFLYISLGRGDNVAYPIQSVAQFLNAREAD